MSDYRYPDVQLIIFAKAPLAGYCKTRLIPTLGEQGAADLQQELISQLIKRLCSSPLCPIQLWCSPDTLHPYFQTLAKQFPLVLRTQQGANLGDRMHHAMSYQASTYTIVVGTDCPLMTSDYIERAINSLYQNIPVVIGPAEDGGYVLLGLQDINITLFEDIEWGSAKVLSQTKQKITSAGLVWQTIDTLWDIDNKQDLIRYQKMTPHGPN